MILAFFLLSACSGITTIFLTGHLMDGPQSTTAIEGALVKALDEELVLQSQSAETDQYGAFEVELTSLEPFYLEITGDDLITTLFSGQAGSFNMGINDGSVYAFTQAYADDLQASFGACGDQAGGIIEGEVVVAFPSGGNDYVSNAWVTAYDELENSYPACYLDDDGTYSEDAIYTGDTGRFAIFGLPDGAYTVEVAYGARSDDEEYEESDEASYWFYRGLIKDSGLVPFYPAWVEPS